MRDDPLEMPPMPTTGTVTRAATARTCASATVRTAGPERPPVPPPSHGPPVPPGAGANARSVLISETASAPAASAACATRETSAVFGVSFTIERLGGPRAHLVEQPA